MSKTINDILTQGLKKQDLKKIKDKNHLMFRKLIKNKL